jgi:hypothetical protein
MAREGSSSRSTGISSSDSKRGSRRAEFLPVATRGSTLDPRCAGQRFLTTSPAILRLIRDTLLCQNTSYEVSHRAGLLSENQRVASRSDRHYSSVIDGPGLRRSSRFAALADLGDAGAAIAAGVWLALGSMPGGGPGCD